MTVHFSRRTAQHSRYSLRGNPLKAPIVVQRTARQLEKDTNAARIPRGWPINRANKMSRGLSNRRNDCFRNSGLQALMHAPKFLHWILSHNVRQPDGTRQYQCRTPLVTQKVIERVAMCVGYVPSTKARPLQDCPACVLKGLVEVYWGNEQLDPNGQPLAFNLNTPQFRRLVQVDTVLLQFTPQAGSDGMQQDPEEFQSRYLQACLESVDYSLLQNMEWERQFDALFDLEVEVVWTCECGAPRPLPAHAAADEGGMAGVRDLDVLPKGDADSVKASLGRKFGPEILGIFRCVTCNHRRELTKTVHIEAAPELLRVELNIVNGDGTRNNNPIQINKYLDLTKYQTLQQGCVAPLKYRLSSVLYHHGSINSGGHWQASVRGPEHAYEVNDTRVTRLKNIRELWENPHQGMQAVVLMYHRVHPKALPV